MPIEFKNIEEHISFTTALKGEKPIKIAKGKPTLPGMIFGFIKI